MHYYHQICLVMVVVDWYGMVEVFIYLSIKNILLHAISYLNNANISISQLTFFDLFRETRYPMTFSSHNDIHIKSCTFIVHYIVQMRS
jgi:hypothetical protein